MRKIKLDYTSEGEEVRRASKEVLNGAQSSSAVTVGEDYFVEFFHKEKKNRLSGLLSTQIFVWGLDRCLCEIPT